MLFGNAGQGGVAREVHAWCAASLARPDLGLGDAELATLRVAALQARPRHQPRRTRAPQDQDHRTTRGLPGGGQQL